MGSLWHLHLGLTSEMSSPEPSPRRSWRSSSRSTTRERSSGSHRSNRRGQRSPSTGGRQDSALHATPSRPPASRGRSPGRRNRDRSPLAQSSRSGRQPGLQSSRSLLRPSPAPSPQDRPHRSGAKSPQPGPAHRSGSLLDRPAPPLGSSESTLTAPSPQDQGRPISISPEGALPAPQPPRRLMSPGLLPARHPPPDRPVRRLMSPGLLPPRRPSPDRPVRRPPPPPDQGVDKRQSPARSPPRRVPEILPLPRTPGDYSSPDDELDLDLTRLQRPQLPRPASPGSSDGQWDRFSTASTEDQPAPQPQMLQPGAPLSWPDVVDIVYQSGLINPDTLPASPVPVRSVIGGPKPAEKRKQALPPSPLTEACLPAAMRSCWGGPWPGHAQHQPPPPNAALHPGPSAWVPDFRSRYHMGPGLDLRPARLSAREKEWAGTAQPPVDHSWLVDIETMARAQLSALSNLEWLFGVFMDSQARASPQELEAVRGFIAREMQVAVNFCGAQIAASTLGRRRAILDALQSKLSLTTRSWLQLQPVELRTQNGLFGPASSQVPEILRQQPLPREPAPRRRGPRAPRRREPPRETAMPATQPPPRQPAATYTPTAAAAPAAPRAPARPRGHGGQQPSVRGPKGPKQQP